MELFVNSFGYYDLIPNRDIWFTIDIGVSSYTLGLHDSIKALPSHIETVEQAAEYVLSLVPQYNTNLMRLLYA